MVAIDGSRMVRDERWYEARADELEIARLAADPACLRQRRLFGPVRVIAVLAFALAVVGLVNVVEVYGIAAGLAVVWALPMVVLGVVLGAERLLLRFAK